MKLNSSDRFFDEWLNNAPTLTEAELQGLDRLTRNYTYLSQEEAPLEEIVKLVVVSPLGVADFGYDFYLLAIASLAVGIAKLLHGQYIRLLDFYFHTLIQQRRYFILAYILGALHFINAPYRIGDHTTSIYFCYQKDLLLLLLLLRPSPR